MSIENKLESGATTMKLNSEVYVHNTDDTQAGVFVGGKLIKPLETVGFSKDEWKKCVDKYPQVKEYVANGRFRVLMPPKDTEVICQLVRNYNELAHRPTIGMDSISQYWARNSTIYQHTWDE